MPTFNLNQLHVRSERLREKLSQSEPADAMSMATAAAADALSDLGSVKLSQGRNEQAISLLRSAIELNPSCKSAFHNLVGVLTKAGALRGPELDSAKAHLLRQWNDAAWAREYETLLYAPKFLNLEFVKGKCNLKCRMCIGTNAAGHPDRLSYLRAADFRRILENAPTIAGVTLSSGDSDPLLHPEFDDIMAAAKDHRIQINLYTNGLPLSARTARAMVESGVVSSINFSIDAATKATYAKVRGGDFDKLLAKIRMLSEMKGERSASLPAISVSFVAMADTVEELPDFVTLAASLGATTVIVDDLSGWLDGSGGNHPASENPRASQCVADAKRRSGAAGIDLQLHEGVDRLLRTAAKQSPAEARNGELPADPRIAAQSGGPRTLAHHLNVIQNGPEPEGGRLACCGWIDGVWVNSDGSLHPCCMIRNAADMGRIQDAPLLENEKYGRVKTLLATGKVFESCRDQRMCRYVQEQASAGIPLRVLTREELGELAPPDRTIASSAKGIARMPGDSVSLPVLLST